MPSTSPERQARWPGMDTQAIEYLESRGYKLTRDWCWLAPRREMIEREEDAIIYLIEEFDYGPVIDSLEGREMVRPAKEQEDPQDARR